MGVIHMVRHGQAMWESENYDQLSDLGKLQGRSLGAAWLASEQTWTHAVSGSMTRHLETADAVFGELGSSLNYDVDDRWNEFDHLALTGHVSADTRPKVAKDFQKILNVALTNWMAGKSDVGESFADFSDRVLAAFGSVKQNAGKDQTVIVFSSGGPISLITSHVLASDSSLFMDLNSVIVNASVTTLIVGQEQTRLLAFNQHGHLPKGLSTYR